MFSGLLQIMSPWHLANARFMPLIIVIVCLRFVIFHAMMITDPQLSSVSYAQMLEWIDDIYDESDWKLMHYPAIF